MKLVLIAAALASLAAPAVAGQADPDVTPLRTAPQSLANARAYILLRVSTAKSGLFKIHPVLVRVPGEAEIAAYRAAKEQAYQAALPKLTAQSKGKPVPTIDDFSFQYKGSANAFVVDSGKFLVDGEMRTMLLEVPPGRYVFYGTTIGGRGLITCNCLGTVSFDAPPGVITDAGSVYSDKVHKPSPLTQLESNIGPTMFQYGFIFGEAVEPPSAQSAVPAMLASLPRRLAQFEIVEPYQEPGATSINRLAPIPGLLEYRHGRPVDPNAATDG